MAEGRVFPRLLAQQSGSWQSCLLPTGAGLGAQPGQKLKWDFSKMLNWRNFFLLNLLVLVPYFTLFLKAICIFWKAIYIFSAVPSSPRDLMPIDSKSSAAFWHQSRHWQLCPLYNGLIDQKSSYPREPFAQLGIFHFGLLQPTFCVGSDLKLGS